MPTAVPWARAVSMSLRTWRRMTSGFTSASMKTSRSRAGTPAARAASTPRVPAVVRLSSQNRPCSLISAISAPRPAASSVNRDPMWLFTPTAPGTAARFARTCARRASGGHRGQQDALAGVLPPFLARFHRLVQQHLDAAPGGLAHGAGRGRQPGDDGDRERDVQAGQLLEMGEALAEVVDDDGGAGAGEAIGDGGEPVRRRGSWRRQRRRLRPGFRCGRVAWACGGLPVSPAAPDRVRRGRVPRAILRVAALLVQARGDQRDDQNRERDHRDRQDRA